MIGVHVAGRNCEAWAAPCIRSILSQEGPEWRAVVVDDASTDATYPACIGAIGDDERIALVRHETRQWGCRSHNHAITEVIRRFALKAEDILVCLDLDDEFLPGCLRTIETVHLTLDDWVTYGNWQDEYGTVFRHTEWTPEVARTVRTRRWFLTHVLAMRVGIWRRIPPSFWAHNDGKPYEDGWDGANMFPAVDLAGPSRVSGISAPIYFRRKHNPQTVMATKSKEFRNRAIQAQRNKPRLKPLARLSEGESAEGALSQSDRHREEVTTPGSC